jgi:hypothetical protein
MDNLMDLVKIFRMTTTTIILVNVGILIFGRQFLYYMEFTA